VNTLPWSQQVVADVVLTTLLEVERLYVARRTDVEAPPSLRKVPRVAVRIGALARWA